MAELAKALASNASVSAKPRLASSNLAFSAIFTEGCPTGKGLVCYTRAAMKSRERVRFPHLPPKTGRAGTVSIPAVPSKVRILPPSYEFDGFRLIAWGGRAVECAGRFSERCLRGRKERFAKPSCGQPHRGFESPSLRQETHFSEGLLRLGAGSSPARLVVKNRSMAKLADPPQKTPFAIIGVSFMPWWPSS